MNKDNRFWKIALPALLAMVMAGAAVCALAGALGLAVQLEYEGQTLKGEVTV